MGLQVINSSNKHLHVDWKHAGFLSVISKLKQNCVNSSNMSCYFYLLCLLLVCMQAGGLIIREHGESETIEISSRKYKESGSNNSVSEKEKQEMIYTNSGNSNMQRRSNAYVPFNSLTLSEGTMPFYNLNTESKGEYALLKMI